MALVKTDESRWRYVVTAPDGSIPPGAGVIPKPSQRTYADPLNGMKTAGCSITIDNPVANFVLQNDCLLKLYRQNTTGNFDMLLCGDVVGVEEDGEGNVGQINITAADPLFRLNKRLVGMAMDTSTGNPTSGQATGFSIGTVDVPIDLSDAIVQVVYTVGLDAPSGVGIGTSQRCGTLGVAGPMYATFAGPIIQQIAATLGGPDFWISPQEPSGSMPSTTIGMMNCGFARGQIRPNTVFEYGCGSFNVAKYSRILSKQGACNHAVALPQGWPTSIAKGDSVAVYDDTTSQNLISRFDDVVSTDVASMGLRTILCQENVAVRKQRQQQITITPRPDINLDYMVDYTVGDIVTARAFDPQTATYRFNGHIRLYGVALTLDESNSETAVLTLIPDQQSGGLTYDGSLG